MFKNIKTIAFFTILSRVLGFIRDFLITRYFGADIYTDMFFVAFKIPNHFRRIFGEGAVNSSVVPILSKIDQNNPEKSKMAIGNLIFVFGTILLIFTIFGIIFSKVLILISAPGLLASPHIKVLDLLVKINFSYIFFIGMAICFMGIMNSYDQFGIGAFSPSLLNISMIVSMLILYKFIHPHIYTLCFGVVFGGLLQMVFSYFGIKWGKIPLKYTFKIEDSTKQILKLMSVTAISGSVLQIGDMIDTFIASFLKVGSISYLYYANILFQLPFAIVVLAISQATLPQLSKLEKPKLIENTNNLLKIILNLSIPIMLYFIFFGKDLITIIFQHGKFTPQDSANTDIALTMFMLGFLFFSQLRIINNAFYAIKDVKTPLKAAMIAVLAKLIISPACAYLFGFWGLALALSFVGLVNLLILNYYFKRKIGNIDFKATKESVIIFFVLLVASLILKNIEFSKIYVIDALFRLLLSTVIYAPFGLYIIKKELLDYRIKK
ncbi:MAG: murein biosynthesis integral membrane protein MurJ [Desulfurella sp.]|uniref:murein biosynthesis integral membrane protein MurJ n=1 Tax=Desulfurella sp. TaxID=1962857 RepID=UPI003C8BC3FA